MSFWIRIGRWAPIRVPAWGATDPRLPRGARTTRPGAIGSTVVVALTPGGKKALVDEGHMCGRRKGKDNVVRKQGKVVEGMKTKHHTE